MRTDEPPSIGLALSGGGFRATLFGLGSLWRLNEGGLLRRLTRVTSVSGGSILAGVLAHRWRQLNFVDDQADNFEEIVAQPVRNFCNQTIDISTALLGHLTPFLSSGDFLARRYARDLQEVGIAPPSVEDLSDPRQMRVTRDGEVVIHQGSRVYLEELDLSAQPAGWVTAWAAHLAPVLFPEDETWQTALKSRLAVVHDDVFDFLSEMAIQVDTRVRIDDETGTVRSGQLWTEESLPAESVLVGLMGATRSRRKDVDREADAMADVVREATAGRSLQMGGKASVGRGRVRMTIHSGEGEG